MKLKHIFSLLPALLLALGLALPAEARTSEIEYRGHGAFNFLTDSEYTPTDLFQGFKKIMPGDVLEEIIIFENTASCCDYVKVYFKAIPHDAANPGRDLDEQALSDMDDLLSKLFLTVEQDDRIIFQDQAGECPDEAVYLGSFRRKEDVTMSVTLEVPIELDNEYAQRIAEVDWVFMVEEYDDGSDLPKTGDHMVKDFGGYVAAMAVSGCGLLLLLNRKRKQKNKA